MRGFKFVMIEGSEVSKGGGLRLFADSLRDHLSFEQRIEVQ